MIKILIACDNDNLLRKLNQAEIEIIETLPKASNIIQKYNENNPDMIILNIEKNELIFKKIINELSSLYLGKFIVISATPTRIYLCFSKIYLLCYLIRTIEKDFSHDEKYLLDESIYDMLWKLKFNLYSKGTIYLMEAISLAFKNNSLLFDTNKLMSETARIFGVDSKNVRNNIDNALNIAFKYENLKYDIDFFNGYYDGRKISLKYFMMLAINHLNNKYEKDTLNLLELGI